MKWYKEEIIYDFEEFTVANKLSGVTKLKFRLYCTTKGSWESSIRDKSYDYNLPVPDPLSYITLLDANPLNASIQLTNANPAYMASIKCGDKYLTSNSHWVDTESAYYDKTFTGVTKAEFFSATSLSCPVDFVITTWDTTTGTMIGQITQTLTFVLSGKDAEPDLDITIEDVNPVTLAVTGDPSYILLGKSDVKVTVIATPKNGGTIKWVQVWNNAKDKYDSPHTFEKAQDLRFFVACSDGRVIAQKYFTMQGAEYSQPTITASVARQQDFTLNKVDYEITGTWVNASWNNVGLQYRLKEVNGSYINSWTTLTLTKSGNNYSCSGTLEDVDYEKAYELYFRVWDKVRKDDGSTNYIVVKYNITTAYPLADWGEEDWHFHVPVDIRGGLDYLSESDPPFMIHGQNPFKLLMSAISSLTTRVEALEKKVDPDPDPDPPTPTTHTITGTQSVPYGTPTKIYCDGKPVSLTLWSATHSSAQERADGTYKEYTWTGTDANKHPAGGVNTAVTFGSNYIEILQHYGTANYGYSLTYNK